MTVTLVFVEGHRDFHFFNQTLQAIKQFVVIEPIEITDYIYYQFKRKDRRLIKHGDEIIIVIRCDGKQNTVDIFLNLIPKLFTAMTDTTKVLMIVDDDSDVETKEKILNSVTTLISEHSLAISNIIRLSHMFSLTVSSETRNFLLGIMSINPNLDHVLATSIRENNMIPDSQQNGDYDEIIRKTMLSNGLNIDQLCKSIIQKHGSNFENFLSRFSIKNSLCNFFS